MYKVWEPVKVNYWWMIIYSRIKKVMVHSKVLKDFWTKIEYEVEWVNLRLFNENNNEYLFKPTEKELKKYFI